MIKIMTKFIAGFAAAASLLLAAGCTNQLDYVNDNTALNKMQIVGFKVSGLDAAYDGATAKLMVSEGDTDVAIGTTTIAAVGEEKSQDSGTAFVKFDEPYIFDGDTLHTSKISMYLQVGTKSFKVADPANGKLDYAKLAVKTSPAGTADKDLVKNYVNVAVYNDVPEYSFVASATETFAIPVYMCDFDISTATSEKDLPDGVKITLADKTGTNNKYTVTFEGLTDNIGTKFVVAGSAISSKDENLGDNWNIMETPGIKVTNVVTDNALIKEVDKKGNITFVFYGTTPSWASNKSPAIKIAAYNVDTDPWTCLLSNAGDNWFFPDYTDGHDVTMTVDLAKLDTKSWKKSDAKYEGYKIYVDGIKVVKAPKADALGKAFFVDGDDAADRIMFVPENKWGVESHFYTDAEINSNGNFSWVFDEPAVVKPYNSQFRLGARIVTPATEANFWDNQKGSYSGYYKTEDYIDKHVTLVIDMSTGAAIEYLLPSAVVDYEFEVTLNKLIVNAKLDNVELIGDFNSWQGTGTIVGNVVNETTEFDISEIAAKDLGQVKIRTVGSWDKINIGAETSSGNIELSAYSKNGKVNIVCDYTSGANVDSIKLVYVD